MDADTPRRRWYRKKRWWAAGAAWLLMLLAAVPLGAGPAFYAQTRSGWLSYSASIVLSEWYGRPVRAVMRRTPAADWFDRYMRRWYWRAIDDNNAAFERELRRPTAEPKSNTP